VEGITGELVHCLIGDCGLVQEIKDYVDLEHLFTSVVDMDDACIPTSKEDPSYYILLEFLQQFLPKDLHQIIDDKKVMIFPN
jgi:hypothetical protein